MTASRRVVRIESLPEGAWRHTASDAIVCIDVLLSTTTIVTGVASGRRVLLTPSPAEGLRAKTRLGDATLVTDPSGAPNGVLRQGGPTWVIAHDDARPLIHVSPLAELLAAGVEESSVYAACLRNLGATASEIARRHRSVTVLAAGEGGERCAEDQMAAAWLAGDLQRSGFALEGRNTAEEVRRWGQPDVSLVGWSRSAERLRGCGHGDDVDFVIDHVDDLNLVCRYAHGEFRALLRPMPLPQSIGSRGALQAREPGRPGAHA